MRKKKAPAGTGARDKLTATRATLVSYPYDSTNPPENQEEHPNLNREIDEALATEDYHAEAGRQLLEEARRLARQGFTHLYEAKAARRQRAILEAMIPEGTPQ